MVAPLARRKSFLTYGTCICIDIGTGTDIGTGIGTGISTGIGTCICKNICTGIGTGTCRLIHLCFNPMPDSVVCITLMQLPC